jgi:hypothetical protein
VLAKDEWATPFVTSLGSRRQPGALGRALRVRRKVEVCLTGSQSDSDGSDTDGSDTISAAAAPPTARLPSTRIARTIPAIWVALDCIPHCFLQEHCFEHRNINSRGVYRSGFVGPVLRTGGDVCLSAARFVVSWVVGSHRFGLQGRPAGSGKFSQL